MSLKYKKKLNQKLIKRRIIKMVTKLPHNPMKLWRKEKEKKQ
jgi:hypothetical protein